MQQKLSFTKSFIDLNVFKALSHYPLSPPRTLPGRQVNYHSERPPHRVCIPLPQRGVFGRAGMGSRRAGWGRGCE